MSQIKNETFSKLVGEVGNLLSIMIQVDKLFLELVERKEVFENNKEVFEEHYILSQLQSEIIKNVTNALIEIKSEMISENNASGNVTKH